MKKTVVLLLIVMALLPLQLRPLDSSNPSNSNMGLAPFDISASKEAIAAPAVEVQRRYSQVPVLMYHVLADYSGTYEQLYVSPLVFRQQLQYLKDQGYQTVTMAQVLEHWTKDLPLPEKPIVLTFDDGYRSMYSEAFPLLQEFGFVGTFYLHTAKINTEGGLTAAMIRQMAGAGMEIGSHTLNHPDLTKISSARLNRELIDSRQILAKLSGSPIQTLAYPAGKNNRKVRTAVRQAGYIGAVTTQYGIASSGQNLMALKRIRVNKSDGIEGFQAKLSTAVTP